MNKIETFTYSDGMQDIFANFINKQKLNGVMIDIGCREPVIGNNSLLFLSKNWKCVGADIDDYSKQWEKYENFKFHLMDTSIRENVDILFDGLPNVIDFLSLDVDGASLQTLENIDFQKFKFRCMCVEHDFYWRGESLRIPQRNIILSKGYSLVINTAAEDWYVDYNLIDDDISNILKNIPYHKEIVSEEMPNILNWLNLN